MCVRWCACVSWKICLLNRKNVTRHTCKCNYTCSATHSISCHHACIYGSVRLVYAVRRLVFFGRDSIIVISSLNMLMVSHSKCIPRMLSQLRAAILISLIYTAICENDTVFIVMANINLPCETISIVAVGKQKKNSLSWLLAVDCSQINKMPLRRASFSSGSECIRHGPLGWVKPRHTIIHLKWPTHCTQFKMTVADLRMCTCCIARHSVFAQCTLEKNIAEKWIYYSQANIAAERADESTRAGQ